MLNKKKKLELEEFERLFEEELYNELEEEEIYIAS